MQARILGGGDALGSGGRAQTRICVRGAAAWFRTDCGTPGWSGMKHAGIGPQPIGRVLFRHPRSNRLGGIPLLSLDGPFPHRAARLTVAGLDGTEERVRQTTAALFRDRAVMGDPSLNTRHGQPQASGANPIVPARRGPEMPGGAPEAACGHATDGRALRPREAP
jgi:hypothetical protein